MQARRHAESLRCAFGFIHRPDKRLGWRAVVALRAGQRENDKGLLSLRLFRHGQAEHGVHIFAAQGVFDGAGGLVDQADLALQKVMLIGDELQSQLLAQGRREADVFAFEVGFGRVGDVVAAVFSSSC